MLASAWVSRAFRLTAATHPVAALAACVGSRPDESKLFGLAHNDAVANTSRERQRQERAGQTSHNAPRASPADDLLPGKPSGSHFGGGTWPCKIPGQAPFCAPSAIRTRGLLLRSNPAVDAVAISGDAGQVRGGPHCCSPSYLVIESGSWAAIPAAAGCWVSEPGRCASARCIRWYRWRPSPGAVAWLTFGRRLSLPGLPAGRVPELARYLRRPGTQNGRCEAGGGLESSVPLARIPWEGPKALSLRSGLLARIARVISVDQLAGADLRLYGMMQHL